MPGLIRESTFLGLRYGGNPLSGDRRAGKARLQRLLPRSSRLHFGRRHHPGSGSQPGGGLSGHLVVSAQHGDDIPDPSELESMEHDPEIDEVASIVRADQPGLARRINIHDGRRADRSNRPAGAEPACVASGFCNDDLSEAAGAASKVLRCRARLPASDARSFRK